VNGTDFLVWLFTELIYRAGTASVLILLLLVSKRIFHNALSPRWHYYIWLLLMIRLIVPFAPESSFSIYSVFYSAAEKINLPVTETLSRFPSPLSDTLIQDERTDNTQPVKYPDQIDIGVTTPGNENSATDIIDSPANSMRSLSLIRIAALLWLSGIIILSVYILCINIAFARNVRRYYTPLSDLRIEGILKNCKSMLGIRRRISILTTKKVRTPSLYGLITPCILVSASYMSQLSDDDIKYIFLHELSHYKRKDIAFNWLLTCLQIIYFFNPLIWYAFYKIHNDCEVACDAEVLKHLNQDEHQQYGNTLIKLIRLYSESNFIPATAGISKNKSNYKRRILMIHKFKKSKWTGTLLALFIIFAVAVVGLTGCATTPKTDTPSENTLTNTPQNPLTSTPQENPSSSITPTEPAPTASVPESDDTDNSSGQEPTDTSDQKSYYGQWLLKEVLAYGAVGTYSSEDAEKMLGKSLSFSAKEANIINDQPSDSTKTIENPNYQESTVSAEDFLMNQRMTFDKLGITSDSVTEIAITGADNTAGCTLLIKDDNTIILIAGGTYFELIKP
jgi:bla regulator protein blaR1